MTNTIRELRFATGEMTQQELAQKVEVSRQTIVAIEKGKYAPTLELAFRIAEAFGKEIGEVFGYESSQ
ncbi:MAG: helix-turn-helix transcriptional regulator [Planctomycetota bacterium]